MFVYPDGGSYNIYISIMNMKIISPRMYMRRVNMSNMLKEFKKFAMKGNVLDLAIGVVIGSAFGKIVTSLVADIIMPVIGFLTGGINFTNLKYPFPGTQGKVTLNYGSFIQNIVDFLIVSFSIFLFVKLISRLKRESKSEDIEAEAPKPSDEVFLLQEIRDLLKQQEEH